MNFAVLGIVFGIVALAELPDTSAVAAVVLGSRYPPRLVLIGAIAAHTVQTVVSVAAGSVVALLPKRPLEALLAVIFLVAAVLVLREDDDDDGDRVLDGRPGTRRRVVLTAFTVVLLAELGDPTQIITVTLAARYGDPLAVGIGAALALWLVSAVAVYGGDRLRRVVPARWLTWAAAALLLVLAVLTAIDAITG
ncbi:MAG TPA: TMEM165/GDT1 family protein [Actinomycetospora sp.]|uniref:TMEM165/GDT1 family protein n=1 Tax=Actinomycetospora sp. TaxID=1872135 RepID=UPI002F40C53E